MALTISTASPATPPPASTSASAFAKAQASVKAQASAAAPAATAQQVAALNQLMAKYKLAISGGAAANTLSGLAKQIMAAAKAANQHVTLPQAPADSNVVAATAVQNAAAQAKKLNLTA